MQFNMETLEEHFLEEIPDGFRMIIEYKDQPVGYGHRQVEEAQVTGIQGDIR